MEELKKQIDKILVTVLTTQEDVIEIKERLEKVEGQQEMTYRRIDGFLNMVDRHEAEIAALRVGLDRVEKRITILETQRA